MEDILAGVFFGQMLKTIEPTEADKVVREKSVLPDDVIELMRYDEEILSDTTISRLSNAWQEAQETAIGKSWDFEPTTECHGTEMLGLMNNLAFFMEVLTYRHLLFLYQTNSISKSIYSKLEQAPMLSLMYIFKGVSAEKIFEFEKIQLLYRLRNKSVHYTPKNALAFQLQLSELFCIIDEMVAVIALFEEKEKFSEENFSSLLRGAAAHFRKRWLKTKS